MEAVKLPAAETQNKPELVEPAAPLRWWPRLSRWFLKDLRPRSSDDYEWWSTK